MYQNHLIVHVFAHTGVEAHRSASRVVSLPRMIYKILKDRLSILRERLDMIATHGVGLKEEEQAFIVEGLEDRRKQCCELMGRMKLAMPQVQAGMSYVNYKI